jgi:hypothetical protein
LQSKKKKLTYNVLAAFRMFDKHIASDYYIKILKNDLMNMVDHILGNHVKCRIQLCWRAKREISPKGLECLEAVSAKLVLIAHRLADNYSTNLVEQFFALLLKFLNGRRVNFQQRGAFRRRAIICGLQACKGYEWHPPAMQTANLRISNTLRKFIDVQTKIRAVDQTRIKKKRAVKKPIALYGDKDIENACEDVPAKQLQKLVDEKIEHFKKVRITDFLFQPTLLYAWKIYEHTIFLQVDVTTVQIMTKDSSSYLYANEIRHRMSTSFFAKVFKTSSMVKINDQLIINILYGSIKKVEDFSDIRKYFESALSKKILDCGLFIDQSFFFFVSKPVGKINLQQ